MNRASSATQGVRGFLQSHPRTVATTSMLALLVSVTVAASTVLGPSKAPGDTYYYNLQTGALYTGVGGQITPITAPGATSATPSGVQAHVFGCGDCGESARYVAWLSKYNEELVARLRKKHDGELPPQALRTLNTDPRGILIGAPGSGPDAPWHTSESSEGRRIVEAGLKHCNGLDGAIPCYP